MLARYRRRGGLFVDVTVLSRGSTALHRRRTTASTRDNCGKQGSITTFGTCPSGGAVLDTNNNAVDFIFSDTSGTSAGAGQRLGAPGPENLASPIERNAVFVAPLLDSTAAASSPPNRVRDFTGDSPNNSTFGTLSIRRPWRFRQRPLPVGHSASRYFQVLRQHRGVAVRTDSKWLKAGHWLIREPA
jgi:hypothetical protein